MYRDEKISVQFKIVTMEKRAPSLSFQLFEPKPRNNFAELVL
jgi:hypothetical protein